MLPQLVPPIFTSPSLDGISEGLEEEEGATLETRGSGTFLRYGSCISPSEPRDSVPQPSHTSVSANMGCSPWDYSEG